jgi:branched-chain amino acid transport system substrate-binding protein
MLRKFAVLVAALLSVSVPASADDMPGVTQTEIKIGGVFPFSGPASAIGLVGKGLLAYVQSINDRGGINGRKINYIALDDAYTPPKTVEQVRKLVESDEVAFMFSQLGTAGVSATAKYLASHGIPNVAIVTGSSRFTSLADYPQTTTGLVSYVTEGTIYAKFFKSKLPNSKYAILYQNDDLGKDHVKAFKAFFGAEFDQKVTIESYDTTFPTIDSQVLNLKASGADGLLIAGTPKFAAQAIRKAAQIGWKATIVLNYPSSSVSATIHPAGDDNAIGVLAGTINKDPSDLSWVNDPGMKEYRVFFDKYLAGSDIAETNYLYGYQQGMLLEILLRQCGSDLSRTNIIRQSLSLKDVVLPTAAPGLTINTSPENNMMWTQMQMQRWNGKAWEKLGDVVDGKSE